MLMVMPKKISELFTSFSQQKKFDEIIVMFHNYFLKMSRISIFSFLGYEKILFTESIVLNSFALTHLDCFQKSSEDFQKIWIITHSGFETVQSVSIPNEKICDCFLKFQWVSVCWMIKISEQSLIKFIYCLSESIEPALLSSRVVLLS